MARFFVLTTEELDELFRKDPATAGDGGFQKFIVDLQQKVRRPLSEIRLEDDDIDRIRQYASDSTRGGWQTRVLTIFGRVLTLEPPQDFPGP